jgi:hypothetical protein
VNPSVATLAMAKTAFDVGFVDGGDDSTMNASDSLQIYGIVHCWPGKRSGLTLTAMERGDRQKQQGVIYARQWTPATNASSSLRKKLKS